MARRLSASTVDGVWGTGSFLTSPFDVEPPRGAQPPAWMSQTRRLTATVAAVPRIFTALPNCIRPSGCLPVFTTIHHRRWSTGESCGSGTLTHRGRTLEGSNLGPDNRVYIIVLTRTHSVQQRVKSPALASQESLSSIHAFAILTA